MKESSGVFDVVVCGGGLAGVCAAVAAARRGCRTCLVQDRPVLGGVSSSEIRVIPNGAAAAHAYGRAGGILQEVQAADRAQSHHSAHGGPVGNSGWDMALYDLVMSTPNLTVSLSTTLTEVLMEGPARPDHPENTDAGYIFRPSRYGDPPGRIRAVRARVANAERALTLEARTFIDATGDGTLAHLAGCAWRMGTEGRAEFGEMHAPEKASTDTMGSTIQFALRDVGEAIEYHAPSWAVRYDDPEYFRKGGRQVSDLKGGFWWIELGVPWHTIHDNETLRHELTRHALGIWDYMKNRDPEMAPKLRTYALDWIGQVPGKRDSRRIMGLYLLNENDIQADRAFEDEVAFGGWSVDLHTPGGLLAEYSEGGAIASSESDDYVVKSLVGPFGIPLRSLIAADVDNLFLAGRDASITHAAMGAARVMETCSLMGQAVGTAASVVVQRALCAHDLPGTQAVDAVQQALLRDGCFLPNVSPCDPEDLAQSARVTASSQTLFAGAAPEDEWVDGGLITGIKMNESVERLHHRRGQLIAVGTDRLDRVSVCLSNPTNQEQVVRAEVYAVDHQWEYRCIPGKPLAETVLRVPPGPRQWIEWPLATKVPVGHYVRLDLLANPEVIWPSSGALYPGLIALGEVGRGRMRRFGDGVTMAFRVQPAQPCYAPENGIRGASRPYRYPNLWRSDPKQALPQWIELEWDEVQTIGGVQLMFPGHLFRGHQHYPALYRDPQCAREYIVSGCLDGVWTEWAHVHDNVQPRRVHDFNPARQASRLRMAIAATHGDPCAGLYEIRCYNNPI